MGGQLDEVSEWWIFLCMDHETFYEVGRSACSMNLVLEVMEDTTIIMATIHQDGDTAGCVHLVGVGMCGGRGG